MHECIDFASVAKRLLSAGMTTAELGRQIGLSQPGVSRLASGVTKDLGAHVAVRLIRVAGGEVRLPCAPAAPVAPVVPDAAEHGQSHGQ